jgi:predicted nucleotidyltransferase component of viral defense system
MCAMNGRNVAASVRARLLNRARETGQDFNFILIRYALERLLYRLSISAYADQFLLKGALLFDLWFDIPHRPTRDADFLGLGSTELPDLETIFRNVCTVKAEDGMTFRPETVQAAEIRKEANYAGVRVTLLGLIDGARCPVQIDIGFGDAVTPGPEEVQYPVMLPNFQAPKLRVYPRYTVVAEKLEAITVLGIANSRMKDFFDLWILSRYTEFDGDTLQRAVRATFDRRRTELPSDVPFGLTDDFARDTLKRTQWQAFLGKNKLEALELQALVSALRNFLLPPISAANADVHFPQHWPAGGPWTPAAP